VAHGKQSDQAREWVAVRDDRESGNIRVTVDLWDPERRIGSSSAIDAFIRAPDGSSVGE
jgi:hypothetical protein